MMFDSTDATNWYKTADGSRFLAATTPLGNPGLVAISEREYLAEVRRRQRAADAAADVHVLAREAARKAVADKLGLTLDELAVIGR